MDLINIQFMCIVRMKTIKKPTLIKPTLIQGLGLALLINITIVYVELKIK